MGLILLNERVTPRRHSNQAAASAGLQLLHRGGGAQRGQPQLPPHHALQTPHRAAQVPAVGRTQEDQVHLRHHPARPLRTPLPQLLPPQQTPHPPPLQPQPGRHRPRPQGQTHPVEGTRPHQLPAKGQTTPPALQPAARAADPQDLLRRVQPRGQHTGMQLPLLPILLIRQEQPPPLPADRKGQMQRKDHLPTTIPLHHHGTATHPAHLTHLTSLIQPIQSGGLHYKAVRSMQKRCEVLPTQFIPRHSHKYVMRKTLVNTKFQWLMKYLDADSELTPPHPNAVNHLNHTPSSLLPPRPIPSHPRTSLPPASLPRPHQPSSKHTLPDQPQNPLPSDSTLKCNPCRSRLTTRIKTDCSQQKIFVEKQHLRNKSLLFQQANRKTPIFFEKDKENRSTTSKIKVKTEPHVQRCKTRAMARARYENEPFVLSPWVQLEENTDATDLHTFF